MKILLIDVLAGFLDFALRCTAEGHDVRVWLPRDKYGNKMKMGDGLVNKVEFYEPSMRWADLILTSDNIKQIKQLEKYRNDGYPIFGANVEVTSWELDRGKGQEILEAHGIECLPTTVFKNYDDAIAFQMKNKDVRYVCKPLGDAPKEFSYVSKSFKDMVFMLGCWKKLGGTPDAFVMQEFTPGIEMAIGGWVGRDGFASFFLENFEFKKLMNGEVGPNTGEMGSFCRYVKAEESKLAREILLPLEAALIRSGYTGYIDVAVIIDKKGNTWPLEFTSRLGWPMFQIQQVLHTNSAQWMKDLLDGKDTFTPFNDIATGVVIGMGDFPYHYQKVEKHCGFPIWGIDDKNRYNIHPSDMMAGEGMGDKGMEDMMVTCGNNPIIVSGTAHTVLDAKEAAYKTLKELEIPNSPMNRTDIGDRLQSQLPELHAMGYATAWEFD